MRLFGHRASALALALVSSGCAASIHRPGATPLPLPLDRLHVELFTGQAVASITITSDSPIDLSTEEGQRVTLNPGSPVRVLVRSQRLAVQLREKDAEFAARRLVITPQPRDAAMLCVPAKQGALGTSGPLAIAPREDRLEVVEDIPFDSYLAGVVASEMPARQAVRAGGEAALRAQAILSRTFALANRGRHRAEGFDVCSGTHCQVYAGQAAGGPMAPGVTAVRRAVRETNGLVLTFHERLAAVFFHSACGGSTSAIDEVWGGQPLPYLRGVRDPFCLAQSKDPQTVWDSTLPRTALRDALRLDARTDPGTELRSVRILQRDAGGRAMRVTIEGSRSRVVRATDFRAAVTRALGNTALPSTRMTITRRGEAFEFRGRGAGHGIGLCQTGALALARRGGSADRILTRFFPGTRVERLSPLRARLAR